MLNINDLSFSYGKRSVLSSASLSLPDGKIGVLLGKNGSGKTTLFKSIIGIKKPRGGSISFNGRDLGRISRRERARMIGYVPQDAAFGDLTVFESVMTGRIPYSRFGAGKRDHEAVERVLKEMSLSEYAQRPVKELSGGERRKTAIARALAQEAELLIFDEPTENLDIANELLIMSEAKRLAEKRGVSVLCSLHDLNQALNFGDRFFMLKDGKIKYSLGRGEMTAEIINDIFDANVRMIEADDKKLVTGELTA